MRRTLMATAIAVALAASPAWAQDTEPAPGTAPGATTDATTQPVSTSEQATSELPATASPVVMFAIGGALSLIAGALLIRRRY